MPEVSLAVVESSVKVYWRPSWTPLSKGFAACALLGDRDLKLGGPRLEALLHECMLAEAQLVIRLGAPFDRDSLSHLRHARRENGSVEPGGRTTDLSRENEVQVKARTDCLVVRRGYN
jgi:hypothetical protein